MQIWGHVQQLGMGQETTAAAACRPCRSTQAKAQAQMVQSNRDADGPCTASRCRTGWPITLPDPARSLAEMQERMSRDVARVKQADKHSLTQLQEPLAAIDKAQIKSTKNCPAMYCHCKTYLSNKQTRGAFRENPAA